MNAAAIRRPLSRTRALSALVALGLAMAAWIAVPSPVKASGFDANAAEQQMFALINQDRAAYGQPALQFSVALGNLARGSDMSVCAGETVHGRSQDMIERNYFSHSIPSCGAAVWGGISNAGISFSSAGENIAWNNYSPQSTSVDQANSAFMNSTGHRDNILGGYNQVGVGAWMAPGAWSGNGGPYYGVIMYTEIFINGPITPPPPPPGTPGVRANQPVKMSPPLAAAGTVPHAARSISALGHSSSQPAPAGPPASTAAAGPDTAGSRWWQLRPPFSQWPEYWPGFF